MRQNHKTKKDGDIEADEIMPAVTIRDPSKYPPVIDESSPLLF